MTSATASGLPERHHHILYFPDGDIILRAPHGVRFNYLFRVYKCTLALHSPVFKDMFSMPRPLERQDGDEIHGVPLVDMFDPAEDIASLLVILYYPSTLLRYKKNDPDSPLRVKGILNLATKYEIDDLRTGIIEYIKADWPMSLDEWDALDDNIKLHTDARNYSHIVTPEPAAAISLAREFDIPEILPSAFLQLSRTSPSMDWSRRGEYPKEARRARWNLLTEKDLTCLHRGKQALRDAVLAYPCPVAWGGCTSPSQCESVYEGALQDYDSEDWLYHLRLLLSSLPKLTGLCERCVEDAEPNIRLTLRRYEIWHKIPEFFELGM